MQAWKELARLPKAVWWVCFAALINRMGTMAILFLPLHLTKNLGYAPAIAGLVMAAYGGVSLVVMPLTGRLVDRFGAGWIVLLTLILSGVVLLFFPLVKALWLVFLLTALFSATNESLRPATMAAISSFVSSEQTANAHALYRFAINLGMSVGPTLGGFLALFSYKALFWVDGITSILAAAVLFGSPFFRAAKLSHAQQKQEAVPSAKTAALRNKAFLLFLCATFPVSLVFFQSGATLSLFVVGDLSYKESLFGILCIVNTVIIVLFEVPFVSKLKSVSIRLLLTLSAVFYALGFGSLAFARHPVALGICVAIWTIGEMLSSCAAMAYVNQLSGHRQRGEYLSYYMMMFSLAFLIAPALGTIVMQTLGSRALWGMAFLVGNVSALAYWLSIDPQKRLSARMLKTWEEQGDLPVMP